MHIRHKLRVAAPTCEDDELRHCLQEVDVALIIPALEVRSRLLLDQGRVCFESRLRQSGLDDLLLL
jgi:hypothetical protein